MLTIQADRFPLLLHPYHNLKLRTSFEGPLWDGCQTVVNMLMASNLGNALTANITIFPEILQTFWQNAKLSESQDRGWIYVESKVLNQTIRITENTIRTALQLNDDNNVLMFSEDEIEETLEHMGYNPENDPRAINKNGFIKPWQFLITQLGACFSRKTINHHEASNKLLEICRAVTLKVPYNFSYYLMRDFASNMWSSRPFLMYPRFLMKIITSQLDFGGIPAGYQRAELILQQNTSIALLRPTNKNFGLVTEQWVLLEIEYGDGIDID